MKNARVATVVLIIGMAFALAACTGPTAKGPIPHYDAKTFFETTAITGASFSHDEETNPDLDRCHRSLQRI